MKFRVLDGKHAHGNKTYKKGEIIESAVDLTEIFKNKFERVYPNIEEPEPVQQEVKVVEQATAPSKVEEKEEDDERGKNVTKTFPAASDHDLLVFERTEGKKTLWFIYDHAELKSPKKGLKSADAVNEYLNDITEDA